MHFRIMNGTRRNCYRSQVPFGNSDCMSPYLIVSYALSHLSRRPAKRPLSLPRSNLVHCSFPATSRDYDTCTPGSEKCAIDAQAIYRLAASVWPVANNPV